MRFSLAFVALLLLASSSSTAQELNYDSMYYDVGSDYWGEAAEDDAYADAQGWERVAEDYHEPKEREVEMLMRQAMEEQQQQEGEEPPTPTEATTPAATDDRPCLECVKEECAAPADCLAGVTLDRCGCCLECARSEGELCDPEKPDLNPEDRKYGPCGDNLQCTKRTDTNDGESICMCRVGKMACGSDGITYPTICELNEEAARRGKPDKYNPQLVMKYWGPCKEPPVIISPPRDSYGPLGANLTLDCEARGHPAPEISWRFVSAKGETIALPNDDQSVSIQMRGGPEPLMVTGWAQILKLDPDYIGIYHCIATNTEGQVYSMASVGVYRNEL